MSAIGAKLICLVAPHMSAFGGKADVPLAPITDFIGAFRPGRKDLVGPKKRLIASMRKLHRELSWHYFVFAIVPDAIAADLVKNFGEGKI